MRFLDSLPDWLVACFRIALLGEIYVSIRAIAVGYDGNGGILIRYYLERKPTEFDLNSIEIVAVNFDALGGKENVINRIDVECVYTKSAMSNLESLSGFIYSRREEGVFI